MKILIISAEAEPTRNMVNYLRKENFTCETAKDHYTALEKIASFEYDCILLDLSISDMQATIVLEAIKAGKKTSGLIVVSSDPSMPNMTSGYDQHVDDHLLKPIRLSELPTRVSTVIHKRKFEGNKALLINDLVIDLERRTVSVHGIVIDLTRKEYDLLLYLASNRHRVISKNAIAEYLSDDDAINYDKLDFIYSHIKNLKRKLHAVGCGNYIRSLYGVGYRFG